MNKPIFPWPFPSTLPRSTPQPATAPVVIDMEPGDEPKAERAPWLRSTHSEPDMLLPEGKTCGDCAHFRRCNLMFGHIAADEVCDWAPSRFRYIVPEAA